MLNIFRDCKSLITLAIGNSVGQINNYAFSECPSLQVVKSFITEPYSISKNVFSDDVYRTCILYIPKGTERLYSRFDGWREFLKIVEMDSTDSINDLLKDDFVTKIDYNNGLLIIYGINDGIQISVYTVGGLKVGSTVSQKGYAMIETHLQNGSVIFVKVGKKRMKIILN